MSNYTWQTPIYDRSYGDITTKTQKAYLNANDLLRIERNTSIVIDLLNKYGYNYTEYGFKLKTDWTMQDYPTKKQIDRIKRNCIEVMKMFNALTLFKQIVIDEQNLDFEQVNAIEFNLNLLYESLNGLEDSVDAYSGISTLGGY